MNLSFEFVPCNLCGREQFDVYLTRKDLNLFIPGDFRLVHCSNCGLVYLNPRPSIESLTEIYPQQYDQYVGTRRQDHSILARLDREYGLKKRVRNILHYKQSGRLLDIGCATGDFLDVMQEVPGWDVYGVEPSAYASEYARAKLGLRVKTGYLEEEDFEKEYFDAVTMWNVLEHLADPLNTLKMVHKLLKPDGMLIFNTPSLDSLDARIYGPYWIGFELPRHFNIFSRQTLNRILQETGFLIVETRCIYGSHAAFMSSLRFWLRDQSLSPYLCRFLESVIFSRVVRLLAIPYFFITDHLNLSSTPTDFCVKAP
jgi:2-polyprenyl-3-methyl-5-hydroxy-6-metoxy-1,4-benzoquinol methylase